jgi:hypothetical protein
MEMLFLWIWPPVVLGIVATYAILVTRKDRKQGH